MTEQLDSMDSTILTRLRSQVAQLQGTAPLPAEHLVPSGSDALDRLLPRGGFAPGTLIEWLAERPIAAGTLALRLAREAAKKCDGSYIVVLDHDSHFYPPAAAAWGVDLKKLLIIRAHKPQDELWAIDQALRCPAVAAVWAPIEHLSRHLDAQCLRRWQLAAEQGRTLGLLLRSNKARGQPCWSDAQLHVSTRASQGDDECWRLKIELVKVRGGAAGAVVDLEIQ